MCGHSHLEKAGDHYRCSACGHEFTADAAVDWLGRLLEEARALQNFPRLGFATTRASANSMPERTWLRRSAKRGPATGRSKNQHNDREREGRGFVSGLSLKPERTGQVVGLVAAWLEECGYPPTMRELSEAMDLSLSTVHHHVQRAIAEGWLTHHQRIARGLRLTADGRVLALRPEKVASPHE